jgi:inhibitor of cysteine peptidase
VKWTSRILIVAVFFSALLGCQKGQKAAASKEERSSTKAASAKAGSSTKPASKSGTSGSTKSGATTAKSESATPRGAHPGVLTIVDNGRSFDVKRGEVIVVKLDASHTAGFRWALTDGIGAVLKQEGSPSFVRSTTKSGKAGSGGTETWRFRAVGLGRETVKLEYGRPWDSIPEREFRFTVTVR